MKVNKTGRLLLIAFLTIAINSCASLETATANTNKWLAQEILPSKIIRNGEIFLTGKLSDGSTYSVFQDDKIDIDEYYYYNSLYQDFGWSNNGYKWTGSAYNRQPKFGQIYINPRMRIAVYFYPKGTFAAFKVSINK
jgi:hypothetical protein